MGSPRAANGFDDVPLDTEQGTSPHVAAATSPHSPQGGDVMIQVAPSAVAPSNLGYSVARGNPNPFQPSLPVSYQPPSFGNKPWHGESSRLPPTAGNGSAADLDSATAASVSPTDLDKPIAVTNGADDINDGVPGPAAPTEYRVVQPHTVKAAKLKLSLLERIKCYWVPPEFASNQITTYKYTLLTFLPVNLFQQFMRVANLYFLFITILQIIPGLSPTSWFTTVFALVIVLAINAIKEGYDDYKRHVSDSEINARKVLVLTEDGKEVPTAWRQVVVGDLVKVVQDSEFPSDLLFLASSDKEHVCYVETANLDGETNLKNKVSVTATQGMTSAKELSGWATKHEIRCEMPNPRLYIFEGSIVDKTGADAEVAVGPDNLLLRGCTLRSVSWVIGVAVFTGADSKIMMNRTPAKRKVTQLERHMNVTVMGIFATLAAITFLLSMGTMIWMQDSLKDWYLNWEDKWPDFNPGFAAWIIQVLRFVILLNGVIPISLYVTLEIVKVFQCGLILNQDRRMYHKASDTPFACHTTTLNEDLGQVQYVMSDKTGTLTQNVMGFVWVSVAGILYGRPRDEEEPTPPDTALLEGIPEDTPHYLTRDAALHAALQGAPGQPDRGPLEEFFEHLAVCNTVVPAMREDGRLEYQASSPDEEALVQGAAYVGYRLVTRTVDHVEVEVSGQRHQYEVLAVLEFNSDRKRMSIICRTPDGKIKLYCKGADTMILARIKSDDPNLPTTRIHLEEMAQAGFRTLCVAVRELPKAMYDKWAVDYAAASVALHDREGLLGAVAEKIEYDMDLLGATAVEDKLQDGVPEAIASLVAAGIHVWVLTGDKVETAISIALACRLFVEDMPLVELRERDFEAALLVDDASEREEKLKLVLDRKLQELNDIQIEQTPTDIGLVMEGGALAICLHPEYQDALVRLCDGAKSIVCCRVTPMQKALVTLLIRKKKKAIVLGIGDGANDVGMIQAAHIGVGIGGREGRAAVLASDFSFAQFRYLTRLLLWHGRSAYKGNAQVVWYAFYKNWIYNLTLVWFAFVNGFSSQPLYTTGLIATFNVCWTSLPTIAYALIEQDLDFTTIEEFPRLYSETMKANRRTFLWTFAGWMLLGTWHSLVVYFVPMYNMVTPDSRGHAYDWAAIGLTTYTAAILVTNFKIAMITRYFTWINHLFIWGISIGVFFAFVYGYSMVWQVVHIDGTWDFSGIAVRCWGGAQFWLAGVILAPALALLPDIAYMCFQRTLAPHPYQVFQEREHRPHADNRDSTHLLQEHESRRSDANEAAKAMGIRAGPSGLVDPLAPSNLAPRQLEHVEMSHMGASRFRLNLNPRLPSIRISPRIANFLNARRLLTVFKRDKPDTIPVGATSMGTSGMGRRRSQPLLEARGRSTLEV